MAIGATEHNVGGLMHWLDAIVALIAANALGVGLCLRLIDPVLGRTRGGLRERDFRCDGGRRAVAGGGFCGLSPERRRHEEGECDDDEEKETSNVQRPTFNVQRKREQEQREDARFRFYGAWWSGEDDVDR